MYKLYIGEKADPSSDQILVDGKMTIPATIEVMELINHKTLLKIILKEGRNRQTRRIAKLIGNPIQDLKRMAISSIELNGLQEGKRRELNKNELISLLD